MRLKIVHAFIQNSRKYHAKPLLQKHVVALPVGPQKTPGVPSAPERKRSNRTPGNRYAERM
jgi:hypothetical protein